MYYFRAFIYSILVVILFILLLFDSYISCFFGLACILGFVESSLGLFRYEISIFRILIGLIIFVLHGFVFVYTYTTVEYYRERLKAGNKFTVILALVSVVSVITIIRLIWNGELFQKEFAVAQILIGSIIIFFNYSKIVRSYVDGKWINGFRAIKAIVLLIINIFLSFMLHTMTSPFLLVD